MVTTKPRVEIPRHWRFGQQILWPRMRASLAFEMREAADKLEKARAQFPALVLETNDLGSKGDTVVYASEKPTSSTRG